MKIILSGATSGTNFGDFLFAHMFQKYISDIVGEENVFWYRNRLSMSDFFCERLKSANRGKVKDMDALVYISGGYFCGKDRNIKERILRVLKYFLVGLECKRRRIPYCIIGLDVAKPDSKWLEKIEKKVLSGANLIVVRNHDSLNCLESYGIHNGIETIDTAFAIEPSLFENSIIPESIEFCQKKILLFHVFAGAKSNNRLKEKVVPIINAFMKKHTEYALLVLSDQYSRTNADAIDDICNMIEYGEKIKYVYDDPIALCKIINRVDTIVTHKLHVGLIGARFGKAVISFSDHTEKISRLYKQLGEDGRSVPLSSLTTEKGCDIMEEYHNKPIVIDAKIISSAKSNFDYLSDFLMSVERKKQI